MANATAMPGGDACKSVPLRHLDASPPNHAATLEISPGDLAQLKAGADWHGRFIQFTQMRRMG